MTQKEVDRRAYSSAAALVENMDFQQLFGDDTDNATDEQLERAQQKVVEYIRRKA